MGKKYMPPDRSLENLKLGAAARKKNNKRINISVSPTTQVLLKKYSNGNISRLIELLIEAHDRHKLLSPQEILEDELEPKSYRDRHRKKPLLHH